MWHDRNNCGVEQSSGAEIHQYYVGLISIDVPKGEVP